MKIIDCQQGSPEWFTARLGIPTASEMDALVSPEGKVRTGAGVETYLYRKVCERHIGCRISETGSTFAMQQGTILELEARPWYSFDRSVDVRTVGFCVTDDGRLGASPDGLVGEDGGLEIKCFQVELSLRTLMEGAVPKEYIIQVQTCLYVTGRQWWDFVSYSRQFPALVVRVLPDPKLQAAIAAALAAFNERFDATLARLTAMTDAENAGKMAAYEARVAAGGGR